MRAAFTAEELRAIAFGRSSRPTMSTTKAWRVGMSNALTIPRAAAIAKTWAIVTCPDSVSAASVAASPAEAACVPTRSRRFSTRSASAPPNGARKNTGAWPTKPVRPRRIGESVSR